MAEKKGGTQHVALFLRQLADGGTDLGVGVIDDDFLGADVGRRLQGRVPSKMRASARWLRAMRRSQVESEDRVAS
ncbi:hypothetical protein GGI59_003712 [Rhizobium lentis]|uniref:Uncharacterized protein n=1 Tax=Rhizobium lentis TaxID=1138194 RepID=A0A7W9CVV1_9HYPH|nr:hypothetical protein [Rhizobium lentis]MBB5551471.1 hypothetical protein [Rhizobium lentis]MBB5562033.1 hypothetical protein [Rhizobium lentis]MBB5568616.1 hypothetical protein [Rhizobium lentis]